MKFNCRHFILVVLFSVVLVFSCSNNSSSSNNIDFAEMTDIEHETQKSDVLSLKRRKGKDEVEYLYYQAVKNDDKLKVLEKGMNSINDLKSDVLSEYLEYSEYLLNYYRTAELYIPQIKNDKLKESLEIKLKNKESEFEDIVKKYDLDLNKLDQLSLGLKDNYLAMKLNISLELISAYQAEKPQKNELESLNKKYNDLLNTAKDYLVK